MDIILASKSPRRQELLRGMGFEFEVVSREVDESFPPGFVPETVALHIAEKKARAFDRKNTGGRTAGSPSADTLAPDAPSGRDPLAGKLLITADTIVVLEGEILGKPAGREDAIEMLGKLSGKRHEVITAVALLKDRQLSSFYDTTSVYFAPLTAEEIRFYVDNFHPFDKAGSYGIQEWIGYNKITRIEGSYTNVVGLPTEKLYSALRRL